MQRLKLRQRAAQVDLVLALEPDLTDLVRETKFRVYNAEWLNAVENGEDHDQVCFMSTLMSC